MQQMLAPLPQLMQPEQWREGAGQGAGQNGALAVK